MWLKCTLEDGLVVVNPEAVYLRGIAFSRPDQDGKVTVANYRRDKYTATYAVYRLPDDMEEGDEAVVKPGDVSLFEEELVHEQVAEIVLPEGLYVLVTYYDEPIADAVAADAEALELSPLIATVLATVVQKSVEAGQMDDTCLTKDCYAVLQVMAEAPVYDAPPESAEPPAAPVDDGVPVDFKEPLTGTPVEAAPVKEGSDETSEVISDGPVS